MKELDQTHRFPRPHFLLSLLQAVYSSYRERMDAMREAGGCSSVFQVVTLKVSCSTISKPNAGLVQPTIGLRHQNVLGQEMTKIKTTKSD